MRQNHAGAHIELAGSSYLYTLGVIATTFAGFAGLTVIFREILGGQLTCLDGFVIRTFIQLGFMARAAADLMRHRHPGPRGPGTRGQRRVWTGGHYVVGI
jgi:hypothetical protein